jgi:hypothetical protein
VREYCAGGEPSSAIVTVMVAEPKAFGAGEYDSDPWVEGLV